MLSYTIKAGNTSFVRHAWNGGDLPPKGLRLKVYLDLVRSYFREQVIEAGGLGDNCLNCARILWHRARLDAWRTLCENCR